MRTMKLMLGASLATAILCGSPSFAQDKASQKFIKDAIEGNLAEIQMGQLAQKNGNSDAVRSFGQMLEKDHAEANQKAIAAANSLGVTPPTEPTSKQKKDHDRMSKLTGAKFDAQFAKHMVADHKKDIREFEKEASRNDAAGSFAKEGLPTLHKHLDSAQSLMGSTTTGKR
jgi:putative membrane protein